MVLLFGPDSLRLRNRPPNNDVGQLCCVCHLHRLPMHASPAIAFRVRLPRHGTASQCRVGLGWRELRESIGRNAQPPLHLRVLYWLHFPLPFWCLPPSSTPRAPEIGLHANLLSGRRNLLSAARVDGDCRHGKSLLAGRGSGHVHDESVAIMQQSLVLPAPSGGCLVLGAPSRQTNPDDGRSIAAALSSGEG